MRYYTTIDNVYSKEWGLSIHEAYLFAWFFTLPSWADNALIEGEVFYFASKNKAIEEIPLLTDKKDTMYRYYKKLKDKGLIKLKKVDNRDYISLTNKSKEWGRKSEVSENNPKNSENNPKIHQLTSENNPTYNKGLNINNKENNNKEVELPFSSSTFYEKWNEYKQYKKTEFKFSYKSVLSEKATLTKLVNLAGDNEAMAIAIIDEAMANGYKGFFALDKKDADKVKNNDTSLPLFTYYIGQVKKQHSDQIRFERDKKNFEGQGFRLA